MTLLMVKVFHVVGEMVFKSNMTDVARHMLIRGFGDVSGEKARLYSLYFLTVQTCTMYLMDLDAMKANKMLET